MTDIVPFTIAIPESQLIDLRERLAMTRWPSAVTEDWSHGQPTGLIRELAEQWRTGFDWRAHEAELNSYPQFTMRYSNSKRVRRAHPAWQAITHFFNHQTHHRGQATTLLTQAGVDIGVTDLIALV